MSLEYSEEQLLRWRLLLGRSAQSSLEELSDNGGLVLSDDDSCMDEALQAIYDAVGPTHSENRDASHGFSQPTLNKWLGDIRTYFKEDVVAVIQQDAIEQHGLDQLLLEPETLKHAQPNLSLVGTLLSLADRIPDKTKDTAREVIRAVVDELRKHLENDIRQAVTGALNRRAHSPIGSAASIDWQSTIRRNLQNYQPSISAIVPERVFFFSRSRQVNAWKVIVALDQSGSMADSVVYGAVTGSIFASLPALDTRMVAFDTEVTDLTEKCGDDPVDLLMGVQLGGGTNINKAVAYCQSLIDDPPKTMFLLITDLYEGGVEKKLLQRMKEIKDSGARAICLLALNDSGTPAFDKELAAKLEALGVPAFASSPGKLPELIHGVLSDADLMTVASKVRRQSKNVK